MEHHAATEPALDATDRGTGSPVMSRVPVRVSLSGLAPVAVLLVLLLTVGASEPSFLAPGSLSVLAGESSAIMLMATGQTVVILLGRIDLAVAALASLASVLIALSVPSLGAGGVL